MNSAGFIMCLENGMVIARYECDFIRTRQEVVCFMHSLLHHTKVTHISITGSIDITICLDLRESDIDAMIFNTPGHTLTVTGLFQDSHFVWSCDMITWQMSFLCKDELVLKTMLSHITEKGLWV